MKRLLIANRGEIARRIIRTAHRMGIATVAVYSDADDQALHVREATCAVALGGLTSAESYLRVDKLIAAAQAAGADAVHPGYGFLSENADFAQSVIDAGLTWVGPPPDAIRALGNKASAKQLALARQVPCLPGYQGEDQTDDRFAREAQHLGYPIMVKATAGGGGRGMRLVMAPDELPMALQGARSEALSGFGSDELLIERALLHPRHVEVQVFADAHGHCIHLGERDCSVQRRHQKIIEESPSPVVDSDLRARMGACAVALAQGAGYVGAGTVEFLLDGGDFFLMEMNTRLQVEHPVTEMRTGLDLVEWQLRVARMETLPLTQSQVRWQGHAIEVRLCAEDDHHTPHAGPLHVFAPPAERQGVRFDHAMSEGGQVPPFYDSMLGKLIAYGADRQQAMDRLRDALADLHVLGLPTNRSFLQAALDHVVFRAGEALIPFLAQRGSEIRDLLQKKEHQCLVVSAVTAIFSSKNQAEQLPSPFDRAVRMKHRGHVHSIQVRELGGGRLRLTLDAQVHDAQVVWAQGAIQAVSLDGVSYRVRWARVQPARWHVQVGAVDLWLDDVSFEATVQAGAGRAALELRAPFNGKVIRTAAEAGQSVRQGDVLAILESMKLEHALTAGRDAVIQSVRVEVGQQVSTGQVLLNFEPALPSTSS